MSGRTRDQEIWGRLPILRFVPHVHEILFCLFRRPKLCHFSLVDEACFIKQVEKLLSSLMDLHDGLDLAGIGRDAKCSDELERPNPTHVSNWVKPYQSVVCDADETVRTCPNKRACPVQTRPLQATPSSSRHQNASERCITMTASPACSSPKIRTNASAVSVPCADLV